MPVGLEAVMIPELRSQCLDPFVALIAGTTGAPELLCLEKTSEIIMSNLWPISTLSTKPQH